MEMVEYEVSEAVMKKIEDMYFEFKTNALLNGTESIHLTTEAYREGFCAAASIFETALREQAQKFEKVEKSLNKKFGEYNQLVGDLINECETIIEKKEGSELLCETYEKTIDKKTELINELMY
jgi:glutathionyl-hydroquinone reductase